MNDKDIQHAAWQSGFDEGYRIRAREMRDRSSAGRPYKLRVTFEMRVPSEVSLAALRKAGNEAAAAMERALESEVTKPSTAGEVTVAIEVPA